MNQPLGTARATIDGLTALSSGLAFSQLPKVSQAAIHGRGVLSEVEGVVDIADRLCRIDD